MGVQAKSLGVRFALLLASVWFAASETLGAQAQSDRLFSSAGEVRSEVGAGPAAPEDDPLRSRSARLDVSALSRARDAAVAGRSDSAMLTLNLFDDAVLRAVVERVERLSSDGVLISGRVVGEPFGSLHLVVRGGLVTGSVRTLGASYRIGPGAAGLHLVGEVDEPARSFECGVRDLPEIAGEALLERAERPSGRSPRSADSASSAGVAAPSILDVAVIYTSAAGRELGGAGQARDEIDLLVAETNDVLEKSGADLRVALVDVREVNYAESNIFTDLDRLAATSDGYMDSVHQMRDSVAVDVVVMLGAWSGRVGGVADTPATVGSGTQHRAFAAVRHDAAAAAFAHELGHVLGLWHDRYAECGSTCPQTVHPYAFGYVNQRAFGGASLSRRWRTIMASNSQCQYTGFSCVRLPRFSNPDLVRGGDPMGVAGSQLSHLVEGPSDAVRSLNQTGPIVGAYRRFDAASVFFGAASYTATEGGAGAVVTVQLSAAPGRPVVVPLAVATTAAAGDFSSVPASVRFAATETVQTFTIDAVDDAVDEADEELTISLAGTVPRGSTASTTVTLVDDDEIAAAPAVTSVSVVSNGGPNGTYAAGDRIEVEVAFTKDVTVSGTPRIGLTIGTQERQAGHEATVGELLRFAYEVVKGDRDEDGIEVAANGLTVPDGAIKDSSEQAAALTHAAVATSHKVDSVKPALESSSVNANGLTLTFDEKLNGAGYALPPKSAFAVTVNGVAAALEGVVVNGTSVRLSPAETPLPGQTVAVSYTAGTPALSDAADNAVASFSIVEVENLMSSVLGDVDGDGLIEVAELAELDAMRHDIDGDGAPSGSGAAAYMAAFGTSGSVLDCGTRTCTGYELTADLDFDTNGNEWIDHQDAYWNGGSGWKPIGLREAPFNATFDGNGHTIRRLFLRRAEPRLGLFGAAGGSSVLRDLRLLDVRIDAEYTGNGMAGALVGWTQGGILRVFVTGSVSGEAWALGGIVGGAGGSSLGESLVAAHVTSTRTAGGLVGRLSNGASLTRSYAIGTVTAEVAGGLVGATHSSTVSESHARNLVSGRTDAGGLVGKGYSGEIRGSYFAGLLSGGSGVSSGGVLASPNFSRAPTVSSAYWDKTTTDLESGTYGSGLTSTELQAPTEASGSLSDWSGRWNFGTSTEYPVLAADLDRSGDATWQEFGYQVRAGPVLTALPDAGAVQLSWTAAVVSHWSPAPSVTYTLYRRLTDGSVSVLAEGLTGRSRRMPGNAPGESYHVAAVVDGWEAAYGGVAEAADAPRRHQLRRHQLRRHQLRRHQLRRHQLRRHQLRRHQLRRHQLRRRQLRRRQLRRRQLRRHQLRRRQLRRLQLRRHQLRRLRRTKAAAMTTAARGFRGPR